MPADTRRQMVDTAIQLFRLHGYNGTGFRQVVAESGAPRGSMYHHFPGGKTQLGVEAVTSAGAYVEQLMKEKLDTEDVAAGIAAVWSWWVRNVKRAGLAGCPVLAVAVESHPEAPELTAAAAAAFDAWLAAYSDALQRSGMGKDEADDYALLILSALEGATGIARAHGDLATLKRVGDRVIALIRARLAAPRTV